MQFTGKSLEIIHDALYLACIELHNKIAMSPDIIEYHDVIEECENDIADIEKLRKRIDKKLNCG